MATYYHVARDNYEAGEDLLSWDAYCERYGETPGEWKWEDAEEGFDTDIVSLFASIEDARDYQDQFGGIILRVDLPEWAKEEGVRIVTNAEGYTAVINRIPAEFIALVTEGGR